VTIYKTLLEKFGEPIDDSWSSPSVVHEEDENECIESLRKFIQSCIEEDRDFGPARVPTQLVEPHCEDETEHDEDEMKEFSTTANIAGYTLPLGMSPPGKKKKHTKWY